jgi:predicted lipopolysaccharide heptosyltransferase III
LKSLKNQLEHVPRMLLIRLRSLGDAILTLPLVEALHCWRPDLQLDILVESSFSAVFTCHPGIHEVLTLPPRSHDHRNRWTRLQMTMALRRRKYSAVLNLHGGTTSILFTIASGAKLRIGQETHRASWIYNARIPSSVSIWKKQDLHTVEHQLSILHWLGLPVPDKPDGRLYVAPDDHERMHSRLTRAGISDYILIQPTATLASKQWSAVNFARLGDHLYRRYRIPVIYTAGNQEIGILDQVRDSAEEHHRYWADLSLGGLFSLIEGCRLFVGNDSGPTHAAAALKKPVVVLWGSSNFQTWHPWKTTFEPVKIELPCSPCPGYECRQFGEPKCILDLPLAQAKEACEKLLGFHRFH